MIGKNKSLPLIYADERGSKKTTAEGRGATRSSSNLRQTGMTWGAVGYPGRGEGIAGIADMARNRRDRKPIYSKRYAPLRFLSTGSAGGELRLRRNCAGGQSNSRLNARLNAASEPYPTVAATSATLSPVD